MGGRTKGEWDTSDAGCNGFVGVQLNLADGTELWRWQVCDYGWENVLTYCESLVLLKGYRVGSGRYEG